MDIVEDKLNFNKKFFIKLGINLGYCYSGKGLMVNEVFELIRDKEYFKLLITEKLAQE